MKKTIIYLSIIVLLSSCYVSKVIAPSDYTVVLANETEQLPFKVKYNQWYLLWGLVPLSHDKTDEKIHQYNLTKVRITTKTNFLDGCVSLFLNGIIEPRTVIIEGVQMPTKSTKSKVDKLRELKELLDTKIITPDEYEKEKRKILNED